VTLRQREPVSIGKTTQVNIHYIHRDIIIPSCLPLLLLMLQQLLLCGVLCQDNVLARSIGAAPEDLQQAAGHNASTLTQQTPHTNKFISKRNKHHISTTIITQTPQQHQSHSHTATHMLAHKRDCVSAHVSIREDILLLRVHAAVESAHAKNAG
jgi:hypothetical protein